MGKVVIWGLKTDLHSHKFIQSAFYSNFKAMGFDTYWVDDRAQNIDSVAKNDTVFAVDVASKFLPLRKDVKYVLHNISPSTLELDRNFINLQVHTNSASGKNIGLPFVSWDESNRTLFQPWGVPTAPISWRQTQTGKSNQEFWVGSIWNNEQNQGNSDFMEGYIAALAIQGIKFIRKGTPTRLRPNGISEQKTMKLIQKSAIGAAVVGNWQKTNGYVPCRLFKNIASGAIPSSNANFTELFGDDGGIFNSDPATLIEEILRIDSKRRAKILSTAQNSILPYTFSAGINRILTYLNSL